MYKNVMLLCLKRILEAPLKRGEDRFFLVLSYLFYDNMRQGIECFLFFDNLMILVTSSSSSSSLEGSQCICLFLVWLMDSMRQGSGCLPFFFPSSFGMQDNFL